MDWYPRGGENTKRTPPTRARLVPVMIGRDQEHLMTLDEVRLRSDVPSSDHVCSTARPSPRPYLHIWVSVDHVLPLAYCALVLGSLAVPLEAPANAKEEIERRP